VPWADLDLADSTVTDHIRRSEPQRTSDRKPKVLRNSVEIGLPTSMSAAKVPFSRRYVPQCLYHPPPSWPRRNFPPPCRALRDRPVRTYDLHYHVATNGTSEVSASSSSRGAKAVAGALGWTNEPAPTARCWCAEARRGRKLTTIDSSATQPFKAGQCSSPRQRRAADRGAQVKRGKTELSIDWNQRARVVSSLPLRGASLDWPRVRTMMKRATIRGQDPQRGIHCAHSTTPLAGPAQFLTERGTLGYVTSGSLCRSTQIAGRHDDRGGKGSKLSVSRRRGAGRACFLYVADFGMICATRARRGLATATCTSKAATDYRSVLYRRHTVFFSRWVPYRLERVTPGGNDRTLIPAIDGLGRAGNRAAAVDFSRPMSPNG